MVETPLVRVERISSALGDGRATLFDLAKEAASGVDTSDVGAVVAATFSNPERFPALSVRLASALGLSASTVAFDIQMACSAYPYALYVAGCFARDLKRRVLLVDGDVQTPLVDRGDHATGAIFSDAVTASLVASDAADEERSYFDFYSRADESLVCPAQGPIAMDGMKVFTFVATEVNGFIRSFMTRLPPRPYSFVPHQANPYMVRQLAKALSLNERLVTLQESVLNPGSCSIPLALSRAPSHEAYALLAGFGAGFSASLAYVKVSPDLG